MLFRRRANPSARGQRGAGTTEYIVLFILVGLTALVMYAKFGRTVGGKVGVAGTKVGELGQEVPGSGAASGAAGGGGSGGTAGGGGTGPRGGGGSSSGSHAGDGSEDLRPDNLPIRVDSADEGAARSVDTRTVLVLGILILAIGALMILAIAERIRKDAAKAKARKSR